MASNAQVAEMSKASGLQENYDAWRHDVQHYHESKKNLQFVQEPYRKVTNAHVKQQEVQYNPITQTFTDPSREQHVKQIEQQNMVETLAQNKVSRPRGKLCRC